MYNGCALLQPRGFRRLSRGRLTYLLIASHWAENFGLAARRKSDDPADPRGSVVHLGEVRCMGQVERAGVTDGSPKGQDIVARRWLGSRQPGLVKHARYALQGFQQATEALMLPSR